MGLLVEGVWRDEGYDTASTGGRFVRQDSRFRGWVTRADAAPGRYHLYVSLACPWAHRTLIMRVLKGLGRMIPVTVVDWLMGSEGWAIPAGADPIHGAERLWQVYVAADPAYTGRVTVPVLWDKAARTIVSNESSEIIRMLNAAFDGVGALPGDYYPEDLRAEIDGLNQRIYETVNNGVYKAGFSTTQGAYEEAVGPLFETLDWLDARLAPTTAARSEWLCGGRLTEADIRLFTTLVRFDAVYVGHFKCNLRRLVDYPNLWRYARRLYHLPGIAGTVDWGHIKRHYYMSHRALNPTGIVPAGPLIEW